MILCKICVAFRYLNERDLEDIIFNSELGVTRAQMAKMSHKLMSREKINYRLAEGNRCPYVKSANCHL